MFPFSCFLPAKSFFFVLFFFFVFFFVFFVRPTPPKKIKKTHDAHQFPPNHSRKLRICGRPEHVAFRLLFHFISFIYSFSLPDKFFLKLYSYKIFLFAGETSKWSGSDF